MAKHYTHEDAIYLLKQLQGGRTQTAFGEELGITQSHLSEIYRGTRNIGPRVAKYLGLEEVTLYQKIA